MKNICKCMVLLLILAAASAEASLYIPAEPGLRGIGGAHRAADLNDLEALKGAAVMYMAEHSDEVSSLPAGVNHVGKLASYMDVPGRFSDGNSAFMLDGGVWWVGISVPEDIARQNLAGVAAGNQVIGSASIAVPPSGATFTAADGAAWKEVR